MREALKPIGGGECWLVEGQNAEVTVATPWGPSSGLRERRLYPGAGTPPEEVARNQRERLFGAVVAVVALKGYEATTVADLLALSGVSRSAFYKHFSGKSDCLASAVSELLETALRALRANDRQGRPREPSEIFLGFFKLLSSEPAASRICFVELHLAGAEGDAVAERALNAVDEIVEWMGPGPPADSELRRAFVGGIGKLIHTRLYRGEDGELIDLAPELWRWVASLSPPPRPLERARRQRTAPGPRFEGYTPAERIARAVASVIAKRGYQEMTTDDIAAAAAVSLSTFYAHFRDKRDATLGALEMSGAQIIALATPAARRATTWEEGVRALYEVICAYFVAEPEMAHLALVGVYAAGPRACARRDRVIDSLTAMLAPGFAANPAAPKVSAEAIGATVYALMGERVRRHGTEDLAAAVPMATYLTLVSFIGPERALAVANGEGRRR
jgi:AcrR family transcriptional regulator